MKLLSRNTLDISVFHMKNMPPIRWWVTHYPVSYEESQIIMESEVQRISSGNAEDLVWLLEHPPLYTGGTSANSHDLLTPKRFPVYSTGRGGGYTYHGPGQRVVYIMLNLEKRRKDLRCFIAAIEEVIIRTLDKLGIVGERREDRVGIWIIQPNIILNNQQISIEEKIAAIGIRIRKWISFHGFSLNVSPNLNHYTGIIPCSINQHGVTSLKKLGYHYSMEYIDTLIRQSFESVFGPTILHEYAKNK
ncbi:lipoyl(octanoyl) transferase LipB [Candidatus Liberibacter africanus]|uniref:Octanoyltransferase n=1 Tax=Candidatus Liberibacter africanus PTSAPSY TaxID=1277257 RepID=A0A0G3I5K5_LIBAF|nr:lipoyl(octanoyl) transferase LipB [Candidatus Liberibacter africanus]AKK20535.1 lipoyltransferase [Candidatus Liberibacter africanus PTSAPSY]QTP64241.1 lipoyl(octanoyl) transferase LipB [Candidatus Liberibacter africanus]